MSTEKVQSGEYRERWSLGKSRKRVESGQVPEKDRIWASNKKGYERVSEKDRLGASTEKG